MYVRVSFVPDQCVCSSLSDGRYSRNRKNKREKEWKVWWKKGGRSHDGRMVERGRVLFLTNERQGHDVII